MCTERVSGSRKYEMAASVWSRKPSPQSGLDGERVAKREREVRRLCLQGVEVEWLRWRVFLWQMESVKP
jgi:hypothetical protein